MNVRYLLWHLSSQSFILELYQNNQVALLDINGLSEQKNWHFIFRFFEKLYLIFRDRVLENGTCTGLEIGH